MRTPPSWSPVGRDHVLAALENALDDAVEHRGHVCVVTGDAGSGKSFVTRELVRRATARGFAVFAGHCSPNATPAAFGPLTEVALAALRRWGDVDVDALGPFASHLARLVPLPDADLVAAETSPMLVGEALVRYFETASPDAPICLLVEDVHWADSETLAVLEYLARGAQSTGLAVIATCRTQTDDDRWWDAARFRRAGALSVHLDPLERPDIDQLVGELLQTDTPPSQIGHFVARHSEGIPLFVETLVNSLVESGAITRTSDTWVVTRRLLPTVPTGLDRDVAERFDQLTPPARRVLSAAAMLGRTFDWHLLGRAADLAADQVIDAVQESLDRSLLIVDDGGECRFRHALTRAAVLGRIAPPQRARLARMILDALDAGVGELGAEEVADLAHACGDRERAARSWLETAGAASDRGALATAETTLRYAHSLVDGPHGVAVGAALTEVLVLVGKPEEAIQLAEEVLPELEATADQIRLMLLLAKAGIATGAIDSADRWITSIQATAVGADVDDVVRIDIDLTMAEIAIERGRHGIAAEVAGAALEAATESGLLEQQCHSLVVLGRSTVDLLEQHRIFTEAADCAGRLGRPVWSLRVAQERADVSAALGRPEELGPVRERAVRAGAIEIVTAVDLLLADLNVCMMQRDEAFQAATRAAEASTRFGLADAAMAHVWLAGAAALVGDTDALEDHLGAADELSSGDPRIRGDAYGRVLALDAMISNDEDRMVWALDRSMDFVREAPVGSSVFAGQVFWALLHTIRDDDAGAAARAELWSAQPGAAVPSFRAVLHWCEAVAAGRAGDAEEAVRRFDVGTTDLVGNCSTWGLVHAARFWVARAAHRDGWGEPVGWLRTSEAFFAENEYSSLATACRAALRDAGASAPRRRRGASAVPENLRALGVTSREVDVLALVTSGHTNREIGGALGISQRTAEHHVASLLRKTGAGDRITLRGFVPTGTASH